MTMTTEELIDLGERLIGKQWKVHLAKGLGVYPSTINRWANGFTPISLKNEIAITTFFQNHEKKEGEAA